jgi:diguanylate cyclase (GGDEF)-like protein
MSSVFVQSTLAFPIFEPFLWRSIDGICRWFASSHSRAQRTGRQRRSPPDPPLGVAKPGGAGAVSNLAPFGNDERAQLAGKSGEPRTGRQKRCVELFRQVAYCREPHIGDVDARLEELVGQKELGRENVACNLASRSAGVAPARCGMMVFTPALAGCLLLLTWFQHQKVIALALWGSGFIAASIAAILIIICRGAIADFWSIIVGNALLATAYGILWCGARKFDDRNISIPLILMGGVLWLIACSIGPVYQRPESRAIVMAAIGVAYTLLIVFELWRGRDGQVWRWPIIVLLLAHAAAIPIHIPLVGTWTHSDPSDPSDLDLLTFAVFESAFVCISAAYLFGGLAKDRIAASFRQASLTDPLTGVMNRRGFFEIGERLLARARFSKEPVALVMFDIDQFKRINDEFGHATGDDVLIAFCRLASAQLRPNDLFARVGGDEFVTLLPNTVAQDAMALAERVRTVLETSSHIIDEHTISTTVSAGVVSSNNGIALEAFLSAADRALFRAKAAGRNCVELSTSILDRTSRTRRNQASLGDRSAA